ncbi:MAG: phosphoribosyltransferase [Clostridiales bacterium]|jgi:hypoxanthine phosphoribosyltransferase|nr:phosphoribosyltransferase [Clostridiales bacterium]
MGVEFREELKQTYPLEYMTWQDFDRHVDSIIQAMDKVNYRPDYIHGVPRGGLPLSVKLSNRLGIPMILDDGLMHAKEGKNILVCDDMSDTGETFQLFRNQYKSKGYDMHIKTAALLYRAGAMVVPDFYSQFLPAEIGSQDYRWIAFPWE